MTICSSPKWSLSCVAALAAMLSGCAVGPDFAAPAAPMAKGYTHGITPERIDATATVPGQMIRAGAVVPDRWWTLLGSTALNDLVDMALAANTDIAIADATLRQAQAEAGIARGALLPELDLGFEAERARVSKTQSDPLATPGLYSYSLRTAGVSVSYPLDLFGGVRRGVEAARAQAEGAAWRAQAARLTIISNTLFAAIEEASLRDRVAVMQESIKAAEESLTLMRRQYELGAIGEADIAADETALAQLQAELPALVKAHEHQKNALSVLLGRDVSQPLPATVELASLHVPESMPLTLPADLVKQRPDIRAAEADLHAAGAQLGVAIAARLPALSISANVGGQAMRFGDMFRNGNPFWQVIGGLTQPLFRGGALLKQQRSAEAMLEGAKASYKGAVLAAFEDVANALTSLQMDSQQLAAAEKAEVASARSFELMRNQLRLGQLGVLAVLHAQSSRAETRNALIEARSARLGSIIGLYQALGGSPMIGRPAS